MSATAWEITSFLHFKQKIKYHHGLVQISRTVQCYPAGWRWRGGVVSCVTSPFPLHPLLKVALCPWGHPEHPRLGGKGTRRKTQSWTLHIAANLQGQAAGLMLLKAAAESTSAHGSLCPARVQSGALQNQPHSLRSCWAARGGGKDSGMVRGEGVAEWEAACVPSAHHCTSLFGP